MSSICSTTPSVTNPSLLNTPYPASETYLPPVGIERDSDGRLTEAALNSIYETLTRDNAKLMSVQTYKQKLSIISDKTNNRDAIKSALENLGQQDKTTMDGISNEFCYYYVRYKYSLEDLFSTLVRTSTATTLTEEDKTGIQNKLTTARNMNTNLNDLIQITNHIAKTRAQEMGSQNDQINALNNNIKDLFGRLKEANDLLKREDATTEIRRRMVEFTQEKNLSANSLLSLYGFLNLVALGLLFYISRS